MQTHSRLSADTKKPFKNGLLLNGCSGVTLLIERVINILNGFVKILFPDSHDDIHLTGALVDHADIDAGVGYRGENSRSRTGHVAHAASDDCDQRKPAVHADEIRVDRA